MGRTVRELRDSLGADEWDLWLRFLAHFDLPDGFLVTGKLCALVDNSLGGTAKPADFVPYYEMPRGKTTGRNPSIESALAFIGYVPPKRQLD